VLGYFLQNIQNKRFSSKVEMKIRPKLAKYQHLVVYVGVCVEIRLIWIAFFCKLTTKYGKKFILIA
jgi:hypothetical protein